MRQPDQLRHVRLAADLRWRRRARPVWVSGRRVVRAHVVRGAGDHLRPRGRRMRQPPLVRHVHPTGDVWRWRSRRAVRSTRLVHAALVRPAERRLRAGGRRLRQPARLRLLRATGDMRRRRRPEPVRLPRCLLLYAHDVRAAEHQLRSDRRRLRQPGQLRLVPERPGVRRRRRSRPVRGARLGFVRSDDVRSAEHPLRTDGGRVRQPDPMRQLPVGSDMRRGWSRRPVRHTQGRVRSAHLPAAGIQLRTCGRRVRQPDPVRRVQLSAELRGRRYAGSVRRRRREVGGAREFRRRPRPTPPIARAPRPCAGRHPHRQRHSQRASPRCTHETWAASTFLPPESSTAAVIHPGTP
jgi:hypothetical protein